MHATIDGSTIFPALDGSQSDDLGEVLAHNRRILAGDFVRLTGEQEAMLDRALGVPARRVGFWRWIVEGVRAWWIGERS